MFCLFFVCFSECLVVLCLVCGYMIVLRVVVSAVCRFVVWALLLFACCHMCLCLVCWFCCFFLMCCVVFGVACSLCALFVFGLLVLFGLVCAFVGCVSVARLVVSVLCLMFDCVISMLLFVLRCFAACLVFVFCVVLWLNRVLLVCFCLLRVGCFFGVCVCVLCGVLCFAVFAVRSCVCFARFGVCGVLPCGVCVLYGVLFFCDFMFFVCYV